MRNLQRSFDQIQIDKLGNYIYALRDPRDKKIFYVGQGVKNRVFYHFDEAELFANGAYSLSGLSSKIMRIIDIWNNDEDVDWLIIAHNLPEKEIPNFIESAIYDALSESQNGELLNEIKPPNSSLLSSDEVLALAATPVNPPIAIENVFIFSIQKALGARTVSTYEATRAAWGVNENNIAFKQSYAVGLINSISVGSFEIERWLQSSINLQRMEFESPGHPSPVEFAPLSNKRWTMVLDRAKGFWQRGNYLIVQFDGLGKFRIKRGERDSKQWYSLTN